MTCVLLKFYRRGMLFLPALRYAPSIFNDVCDFISGILMGLSVVEILAGIGIVGKQMLGE